MGHDAQINSVEFSHKNQLIISSSDDGTARVWKPGKVDAAAVQSPLNPRDIYSCNCFCLDFSNSTWVAFKIRTAGS